MPSIEECFERAPKLAQQIVNYSANLKHTLKNDVNALVATAGEYQRAKAKADKYRKSDLWNEEEGAAEETAARQLFAEGYKAFVERHPEAELWFSGR